MEIVSDDLRLSLRGTEICPQVIDHLLLGGGPLTPMRIRFDILVHVFVTIQVRTIRRQEEQPKLLTIPFEQRLDLPGPVHGMTMADFIEGTQGISI